MDPADVLEIATTHGLARLHHHPAPDPWATLVLGHGAGGGTRAPDLQAATATAVGAGVSVVLTEQPYRVAGRRAPAPANQLDTAWREVLAALRDGWLAGLPLLTGGRSSGARVACRTADDVGACGVLCLAFPVHPPGKGDDPSKSRLPELAGVTAATLVVQGERDPFGMPPDAPGRTVVQLRGDHSLKGDMPGLRAAVGDWLNLRREAIRLDAP
ncbi:alpha/beta hydrolase family protein [Ruania halotolerans]|uniref:alpha/beta hydrolase family protein n=1 Tax=Ruania halotolerans TaxID=2897773 RepID=UPI001E3CB078|nr:alpha/beta family hydrolase [Ruania halotolerans]UFU07732.1 hypothetical protein LQF10_06435 [Ruania halotolerans]